MKTIQKSFKKHLTLLAAALVMSLVPMSLFAQCSDKCCKECKDCKECCQNCDKCCKAEGKCNKGGDMKCEKAEKGCCKKGAQCVNPDSLFMLVSDEDIYSRKFAQCDLDEDGKVTFGELAKMTKLVFPAGKMNILGSVDFLKYCPDLTALYIGDTALETIDLSNNPKLEKVALPGAMWLKTIILAKGCNPQIEYPRTVKKVSLEFVSDPDDPNAIWTE